MAQAHCTSCNATVTVRDGACLVGHPIPLETVTIGTRTGPRGRRRAGRTERGISRGAATRTERREPPNRAAPPVAVLPPERHQRVSPLMEMFGFGETIDPPWEIDAPEPEAGVNATTPPKPRVKGKPRQTARQLSPIASTASVTKSRPKDDANRRRSVFDAIPRLGDLVGDTPGVHENTGTLIERMWKATDDFEPMEGWSPKPDYVDRLGQSSTLRWVVGGLVGLVVVAMVVPWLAARLGADPRPERIETAIEATAAAQVASNQLGNVIAVIADPDASGSALNEAAVRLSEFDSATRRLRAESTALGQVTLDTPAAQLPVGLLASTADTGSSLEHRVGTSLTYRLVFARAFVLPEALPVNGSVTDAADISFELSAMIADTDRALEQLPFETELEAHRRSAAQALADIEVLAGRYVEAVRAGERAAAERHRTAIRDIAASVHAELDAALPALAADLGDQLDAFEGQLREATNAVQALELD